MDKKRINSPHKIMVTSIASNPFEHITTQTSRKQLFEICHILENQNMRLKEQFKEKQKKTTQNDNNRKKKLEEKGSSQLSPEELKIRDDQSLLQEIKKQNNSYKINSALQHTYELQLAKITEACKKKQIRTRQLQSQEKKLKQKIQKGMQKLEVSNENLLILEDKKNKVIEEMKNMKEQSDRGNQLMDELMKEYYDTLKVAVGNEKNSFDVKSDFIVQIMKR